LNWLSSPLCSTFPATSGQTLPTSANGQPTVAFYMWDEDAGAHLSWSITVLGLRGERIAEITSFLGREHFGPFGLPAALP
jgi:RNA polymerase sigma-70 factor, ECF subfamily